MFEVKNVYKVYDNGTVALKNISLELQNIGFVAIVGTSGCGKSTLINLMSNNDELSKGEILFDGKSLAELEESTRDIFACIYQDYKLIQNLTVYQNIAIGYELASKDIDQQYILKVAEQFGLIELLDQKVFALSGGQQQRVAIARAVVRNPKVIFADEPTGNLDSFNAQNVFEILKELSKNMLVVVVSHDKNVANYADRIIELSNGKLLKDNYTDQDSKVILDEYKSLSEIDVKNCKINNNKNIEEIIQYESIVTTEADIKTKKATKIGTNSIFSYSKAKSEQREKTGLSLKSTLGLTAVFNNKGIAKKITLIVLSIIMIMLIFMTSAAVFSSPESSFYNIMKSNKTPFITMDFYADNYSYLSAAEYDKIKDFVKKETGSDLVEVSRTYLNDMIDYIHPEENVYTPPYANAMLFSNLSQTIYTDDPSELGLKMLIGEAPKINAEGQDEIAISKTFFDYLCLVKKFKLEYWVNGEIIASNVDFDKIDLIGTYIPEFHFKITGVFDDLNDYDMSTPIDKWNLRSYNNLSYTIIRPKAASIDTRSISNYNKNVKLHSKSFGRRFFNINPNNASLQKYYYNQQELNVQLAQDEILIDSDLAVEYSIDTGKELKVGDTIQLDLIIEDAQFHNVKIEKTLKSNLNFKVKEICNLPSNIDFVVNEDKYEEWVTPYFGGIEEFAINSKFVTPKFMKKIRNFIADTLPKEINDSYLMHNEFYVTFDMTKHVGYSEYDNEVLSIARFYVGVPLLILSIIIFAILSTVLMSDLVKEKANDILILQSLGAKKLDLWKIFGFVALFMLALQFVAGCLLGMALTYGLNLFWMIAIHAEFYIPTFFVSGLSMLVLIVAMLAISGGTLGRTMTKLKDESLIKSFQKQKQ